MRGRLTGGLLQPFGSSPVRLCSRPPTIIVRLDTSWAGELAVLLAAVAVVVAVALVVLRAAELARKHHISGCALAALTGVDVHGFVPPFGLSFLLIRVSCCRFKTSFLV